MNKLKRSTPEAQGLSEYTILSFFDVINCDDVREELHSAMVIKNGYVVGEYYNEPYNNKRPQEVYSMSKSVTAIAIGFAVHEGKLSLEDLVVEYFLKEPFMQKGGSIYEAYKNLRIKHLLTMTDGQERDIFMGRDTYETDDWIQAYFKVNVIHQSGEKFYYNNGASYILAVIFQKVMGMRVDVFLSERLFEPLGFGHWYWQRCPKGYNTGGYGLNILTEDIGKIGVCLLNGGMYEGESIIPKPWIEAMTTFKVATSEEEEQAYKHGGYGYQIWMERGKAFRADGAFGQICLVSPEDDLVVAVTSGRRTTKTIVDGIWDVLVDGVDACDMDVAGAKDDVAGMCQNVVAHSGSMVVSYDNGAITCSGHAPEPTIIKGSFEPLKGAYVFEKPILGHKRVEVTVDASSIQLSFGTEDNKVMLKAGIDGFVDNEVPFMGHKTIAKTKAYKTKENEITLYNRIILTPHVEICTISLSGDTIHITEESNVGFGGLTPKTYEGYRQA